jgi:hypothetical protein
MSFIIPFQNLPHTLGGTRTTGWETLVNTWFIVQLGTLTIPVVLKYIFPVAAVAATVGLRWPLCINHTKKAVKFKYTFKLYQYFSHLGISACFKHRYTSRF